MNEYKVKLPIFEGPLDLLLHLIRQNEMEISEISISQITTQYLEYLRLMESLDLEIAGDYLVMAASLLNIKLRSLLPAEEEEAVAEETEELDNYMSARQLMNKLIEYRKFKEAAQEFGMRAERQAQIFMRDVALPALSEAQKDESIHGDLTALLGAFSRVLKYVERRNVHRVREEEYTIDEKIAFFRRQIVLESRLSLNEIFDNCQAKIEMIVTVIAILELCRLKELRVRQNSQFGDVFVFRMDAAPEPEYEAAEGSKKLAVAAALERIEAEIFANRTGVVDDGVLPDDEDTDADSLLDAMIAENGAAPAAGPAGETAVEGPVEAAPALDAGPDDQPEGIAPDDLQLAEEPRAGAMIIAAHPEHEVMQQPPAEPGAASEIPPGVDEPESNDEPPAAVEEGAPSARVIELPLGGGPAASQANGEPLDAMPGAAGPEEKDAGLPSPEPRP